jgi:hypothetical protein
MEGRVSEPIAAIVREPGGIPLDDWLNEIAHNPALRTKKPVAGTNPFTRQPMEYRRPYAAHVSVDGTDVGSMVWEANHILMWGNLVAVAPIARAVAARLNARFLLRSEFPEQIDDQ